MNCDYYSGDKNVYYCTERDYITDNFVGNSFCCKDCMDNINEDKEITINIEE